MQLLATMSGSVDLLLTQVTHVGFVSHSPTGCLYSRGMEHRSILPESREAVKLSPSGSRIPVTVTGGELPSMASGEGEEDRARDWTSMVVIWEEEDGCIECLAWSSPPQ